MLILIFSIGIPSVFLLGGFIWLLYNNWSEKVIIPIVASILAAFLTGFITLFLSLKESKIEPPPFTTTIIFDEINREFPSLMFPESYNTNIRRRLDKLRNLETVRNGKDIISKKPTDLNETISYLSELIEYKILSDLKEFQKENSEIIPIENESILTFDTKLRVPYTLSEGKSMSGEEVYKIISSNRFAKGDFREFEWKNSNIPAPPNTSLEIKSIEPSINNLRKRIILLKKNSYFTVEITIEQSFYTNTPFLPQGIILPRNTTKDWLTYIFVIRMRADFEKWTSSNPKTEEYKEWVNYLFREIRTDLSDTKETSNNF